MTLNAREEMEWKIPAPVRVLTGGRQQSTALTRMRRRSRHFFFTVHIPKLPRLVNMSGRLGKWPHLSINIQVELRVLISLQPTNDTGILAGPNFPPQRCTS